MTAAPTVYTVPPWRSFADSLAAGLLDRAGDNPEQMADTIVLLPTRRAIRALSDAFLRHTGGRPTVLPRMSAIGDIDEEVLLMDRLGVGAAADFDLPPAVSEVRRRLLLSRLIGVEQKALRKGRPLSADQAARLAVELARLLDQVQVERLSFDKLESLVPEDYAGHWQIVLRFLRLLTRHWPGVLAEQGLIDGAERRNRLLDAQAEQWRAAPPATPVIAAGSTGTVPATADLLDVVARLPRGAVVLPGLDRDVDPEDWAALPPGHPQYGIARLLDRIGVDRDAVEDWPHGAGTDGPPARAALVSAAMQPAESGGPAASVTGPAIANLARIDCANAEEEAGTVALLLREALDTAGKTAALVTPDRALARRVAAELRRWDITVDDSAGTPLALAPAGAFLRLTARMAATALAPVDLLAALKHPLAAGGMEPAAFRARARELERAVLRGPRPGPGFAGLGAVLRGRKHADLRRWLARLRAAGTPFVKAIGRRRAHLADLLAAHVAFAEWLAAGDGESGAARLWAGESGEAAAQFTAALAAAADGHPAFPGAEYPGLLDALMAGQVVRPRYGGHPRLAIWGPLEARLQRVDRLVLGGLNEGTWPEEVRADPWMSRPMRRDFGLQPLERQIGLAAHDFAQAFCAPEVFLTRAERVEGTPTVESRWLLRLDVALQRMDIDPTAIRGEPHLGYWRQIDRPARYRPRPRPEPRPPVAARPRALSVTRIETWLRDPYAIYARHVLGLRALEPIDADPDAADRGTIIHDALDRFLRAHPDGLPDDPYAALIEAGEACFRGYFDRPGVRAFWWPRFERIARWFAAEEAARRPHLAATWSEVEGMITLEDGIEPFQLRAMADRIDRLGDGRLAIIDYKTGAVPRLKDRKAGLAPQLPLEAVIAAGGGFEGVPAADVAELAFWRLTGRAPSGEVHDFGLEAEAAIDAARAGLIDLVRRFDDPATPYLPVPRPAAAPRFTDYAHLARILEWSAGGGSDE